MATYNWAYRPGLQNKYGIVINGSAEDEKPSNACYVGLFGNDITGNGSRLKPFRTVKKATSLQTDYFGCVIIASGTYREVDIQRPTQTQFIGDGDVTFDWTYFFTNRYIVGNGDIYYNLKFLGNNNTFFQDGYEVDVSAYDCTFNKCIPLHAYASMSAGTFKNCIFNDYPYSFELGRNSNMAVIENCTFNRCRQLVIGSQLALSTSCIYNLCNINITTFDNGRIRYSLFNHCNFKIGGEVRGGALYPNLPDGFEYIDDIDELRSKVLNEFPISVSVLNKCEISDPKFNNEEIGDYSLAFDSPAKNLSYFGTYIGARSIAYPIKAKAIEAEGDFDFSTLNNLTIDDNSIILTNPELDASIETIVKANLAGRELAEAPVYGFNADRNGQYIDSIADLADVTIGEGTDLQDLTPYIVENSPIIIDGNLIQPGERFSTDGVVAFTTYGGGVCREIIEAPQRHTIMARFSNGGPLKNVGDALIMGNWYFPVTGTINYNGVDYSNRSFKAIDTNSFTTPDGGTLIEAFADEEFQHYEPGIKFTSNNVGNVRTGEILRGNGDPEYLRGIGFEFPINARFIQLKYIIRVNNLKP